MICSRSPISNSSLISLSKMGQLVTIAVFQYSTEATVAQTLLDAAEIPYYLKDALTVEMDPFFSNAIGGVKLQVDEEDVEAAMEVLKDANLVNSNVDPLKKRWAKFDKITANWPVVGKLYVDQRLALIFGLLMVFIGIGLTLIAI